MFRAQENALQPDPKYSANLKELGYYIDQKGCIRDIEAPERFYWFHCTNDDRHNEVRGEAMRICHRREVSKRLAALGLKELYLPTLSNSRPDGPHIPILAPAAEVLKTRKRVIVIINDDTYQDLGILAYRELQREGGVNGGSVSDFVKGLVSRTRADIDPNLGKKLAEDGAGFEKDEYVPGVIVLNNGQLLYSHKFNRAMSMRSWAAMPRKSIAHDCVTVHEVENRVEGHKTSVEHIRTVFNTVIKNPDFISPEAEVYVVAIENGFEKLINVLSENFYQYADRITALAVIQSPISGHDIKSLDVKAFLHTRARHWQSSYFASSNPSQCNALPSNYVYKAAFWKPEIAKSIDWLEKPQGVASPHADTLFANISEIKAAIAATPQVSSDDGFHDLTPICPTFGGGDTWVGECIFTQPIVQQAVLLFFEDVAQDPMGFCNPKFDVDVSKPFLDTLSLNSQLPEDTLKVEDQEVLGAQEELRLMQAALQATPQNRPDVAPSLLRLQKRIERKEAEIKELKQKALAGGALGADRAPAPPKEWELMTNGEKWTEKKPGKPVKFAGVQADSNVVASAGCLNALEDELAKLELEED